MLRNIKKITIASVSILLASCSYVYGERGFIQNRDTHYLRAYATPPLIIPCGLSSSTIGAHYPVAQRSYPRCEEKINLTPPELLPAAPKAASKPVPAQPSSDVDDDGDDDDNDNTPAKPQTEPKLRPRNDESAEAKQARQQAKNLMMSPHYYYDPHTRSAMAKGKLDQVMSEAAMKALDSPAPRQPQQVIQQARNTVTPTAKPFEPATESKTDTTAKPAVVLPNAYVDKFARH